MGYIFSFHTLGENFLPVSTQQVFSSNVSLNVFPNPMGGAAVFDLGETNFRNGVLELFDLQGKQLLAMNFDQPRFEFKRNGLASGAYFYLVKLDGKDAVSGKLLIGK